MKTIITSLKVVSFFFLFLFSCNKCEQPVSGFTEAGSPVEGDWEARSYFASIRDTMVIFYHFGDSDQLEFRQTPYQYGQPADTVWMYGSYTHPAPNLLMLKYKFKVEDEYQCSMVSRKDTLIFTTPDFWGLTLWGDIRKFKQIAGEPYDLTNATYYNVTRDLEKYVHSKFVFKGDSAFLYSAFTPGTEAPEVWPQPMRYRVRMYGGLMEFYSKNLPVGANGYTLYHSDLIFSITPRKYLRLD